MLQHGRRIGAYEVLAELVPAEIETGTDVHALIDAASRELRRALGVPEQHLESWPDLPVADISTRSPAALVTSTCVGRRFTDTTAWLRRILSR